MSSVSAGCSIPVGLRRSTIWRLVRVDDMAPKLPGADAIPELRHRPETPVGTKSAPGETRTPNLLIRSQMLYPLSYGRRYSVVADGSAVWRRREDLNLRSRVNGTTH